MADKHETNEEVEFQEINPEIHEHKDPMTLLWENVVYKVRVTTQVKAEDGSVTGKRKEWKQLLKGITGCARAGRLMAIMGPSGAGKTTFLNLISGRIQIDKTHQVEGCAFLNDMVLENSHKKHISYVAQDDIVMGKETPRDALTFSVRMRTGCSAAEAEGRVNSMMERLHLTKCADTILGVPGLVKGVSGGEKKRTNIGSELIRNPRILFLDEPTTGLDSVNALRVGSLLKELANKEGRTVLCTIHTPSSELFAEFDDVLLLAQGRVAYHGPIEDAPAWFASIGHAVPPRYNPSEFYMKLLQSPPEELTRIMDAWEAHINSPQAANNLSLAHAPPTDKLVVKQTFEEIPKAGFLLQNALLVSRSIRLFRRDPAATIGRLVQTLFFAILLGLFFFNVQSGSDGVQDREGAMFMIVVNAVFMAAMSGLATFPPERAVFLMEQSNEMYSPWTFFFAKTLAETPFQIFFPSLFAVILYFMIGLHNSAAAFFTFLGVIICIANCGHALGLFSAAFFETAEVSMAFLPMIILPMFIVAGLFASTDRLDPYWTWLTHISFIRYGYVAIAVNEFSNIGSLCDPGEKCRYQNGAEVLTYLGFDGQNIGIQVMAILLIMLGLRFFSAASLAYQGASRKSTLAFKANLHDRNLPSLQHPGHSMP